MRTQQAKAQRPETVPGLPSETSEGAGNPMRKEELPANKERQHFRMEGDTEPVLKGPPSANAPPPTQTGTKWEDVPDDWECPVCGASKDDFEKE